MHHIFTNLLLLICPYLINHILFAYRAPNFMDSRFYFCFDIHPAVIRSTNNRIILCSYYVQLFATLCEQERMFVHNVIGNVVFPEFFVYCYLDSHVRTTKLSCQGGNFF